jgi:hypothetical protein
MNGRDELIKRSIPFLEEVKDKTTGKELELWLNETFGPPTALYKDLARLTASSRCAASTTCTPTGNST